MGSMKFEKWRIFFKKFSEKFENWTFFRKKNRIFGKKKFSRTKFAFFGQKSLSLLTKIAFFGQKEPFASVDKIRVKKKRFCDSFRLHHPGDSLSSVSLYKNVFFLREFCPPKQTALFGRKTQFLSVKKGSFGQKTRISSAKTFFFQRYDFFFWKKFSFQIFH
jgi:hypothetical protein